jgi:ProQ/FINO family
MTQPAVAAKRKRAADATAWLKAAWPDLFSHPLKPLAIGIGAEIAAKARDAGHASYAIGTALHRWTNSRSYLAAIAAHGAVRWGLSGTAVDFVASEHQAAARLKLIALGARDVASEQIKIPDPDPDLAIKNEGGKESGLAGGAAGPQLAEVAAVKAAMAIAADETPNWNDR